MLIELYVLLVASALALYYISDWPAMKIFAGVMLFAVAVSSATITFRNCELSTADAFVCADDTVSEPALTYVFGGLGLLMLILGGLNLYRDQQEAVA